ncbi:MAG: Na(+)/H(+) antiporter subunit B [Acidobacteriota bacterium]
MKKKTTSHHPSGLDAEPVLRVVSDFLVPWIWLLGLYVTFHGEAGPGGGFQGGVIIASGFILHVLVHGEPALNAVLSEGLLERLCALGALFYAGVGVFAMIRGGNFLDYDHLVSPPGVGGQPLGITLVELGVALTVAAVMTVIFSELHGIEDA